MQKIVLLFSLFFLASLASAQVLVKGTVKDSLTKQPLVGVTLWVEGTESGANADENGNFELETSLTEFDLVLSYISFKTQKVHLSAENKKVLELGTLWMAEENISTGAVEIVAQRSTNTETANVLEMKKAEQVVVAVSNQQIAKSSDRDAAQVMKRVSGVNIMNDRFVMVRGLSERYNTVMLNNAITPSTEIDSRSFSFDLIPSGVIDRLLVFKNPSADLPADMGGAVIKIFTKSEVEENFQNIGFSLGYRNQVSFASALNYQGSKTDFLGFDNGMRKMTDALSSRAILNGSDRNLANQQFLTLSPFYQVANTTLLPDLRLQSNVGRKFKLAGKEAANISYLYYSNTNSLPQQAFQKRYEGVKNDELANGWEDKNYANAVKWGFISNTYFPISSRLKIDFKNFFNRQAIKETIFRQGHNYNEDLYYKNYAFRYETKNLYSSQLSTQYKANDKSNFDALLGYNFTQRSEPDFRRISTSSQDSLGTYKVDLPQVSNPSLSQGSRFWSKLQENAIFFSANGETVLKKVEEKEKFKLRYGLLSEYKARNFDARWFGYVNPRNVAIETLSLAQVFDPKKLMDEGGLSLYEGTNYDDAYTAQNLQVAAYGNAFYALNPRLTLTGGVRTEWNRQQLQSKLRGSGIAVNVDNPVLSLLPSFNTSYKFSEKSLLRGGYGMSVNRPEFRELAPFSYYDFDLNIAKTGNPSLKSATIHNVDARYEFYPSSSEIVSLGAFYKKFLNPIEAMGRASGSGTAFYFANPTSAINTGVELEIRKNLSSKFQFVANAAYIYSRVDASNLTGQLSQRALQGQAPYLVNGGIYYNANSWNCNLLYNVVGKRIFVVGDNLGNETIYEMPRHSIDFNVSKTFSSKWETKFSVNDLLNAAYSYQTESGLAWRTFQRGTAASLLLQYNF